MATRVTYRLVPISAQEDEPLTGEAEVIDRSAVIPHVEAGWCQVANAEFIGGHGGDENKRWLLHVIVFEPMDESAD